MNTPELPSPRVSIVVPVYNEEEVLPLLHKRLTGVLKSWRIDYEVILVDDGSQDETQAILRAIHEDDARWKVLRLSRNFGHQAAIMAGIQCASGDCVMILDADLQDPPEVLTPLLEKWREGYEVVYTIRRQRKEGLAKRLVSAFYYRLLARIAQFSVPLDSGDFCLIDRSVADVLCSMPERNLYLRGLRTWVGFRQVGVEYERDRRMAGKPKYTFLKLLKLGLDGILSFSVMPLRLSIWFGLMVSGISFIAGLFFIAHRLMRFRLLGHTPAEIPGIATAITAVLFLGGIQLICLGMLGEYVARILDEAKQRPRWIVSEAIGFRAPAGPERAHRFMNSPDVGTPRRGLGG